MGDDGTRRIPKRRKSEAVLVDAQSLLEYICILSGYACRIANVIRSDPTLLPLLTEEKPKQVRGVKVPDFKTLADVLIQERLKYLLVSKYPILQGSVFGEECPEFTSSSGNSFILSSDRSQDDTTAALTDLLDGNSVASARLTTLLYEVPDHAYDASVIKTNESISEITGSIDLSSLGIWIDPIDGTSSYIDGGKNRPSDGGLLLTRCLGCVCVLIGGFRKDTGEVMLGVVGRPFDQLDGLGDSSEGASGSHLSLTDKGCEYWRSALYWGIKATDNTNSFRGTLSVIANIADGKRREKVLDTLRQKLHQSEAPPQRPIVLHSKHESPAVLDKLTAAGFDLRCAPCAGYKLLAVHENLCAAWICSLGSTYKWDTCAGHAILAAQGGNIVDLEGNTIKYNEANSEKEGDKRWSNAGGVVATRDSELSSRLVSLIRSALGSS